MTGVERPTNALARVCSIVIHRASVLRKILFELNSTGQLIRGVDTEVERQGVFWVCSGLSNYGFGGVSKG